MRKKKTEHGAGIAATHSAAVDRLPEKKRNYTLARVEGKNITESAAAAGVSRRMGSHYENDDGVRMAYRDMMRRAMSMSEVVSLVKGGAHATMPTYNPQGKKLKDRADWKTRRPYIEMAREDAGFVERNSEASNATMISVVVDHIGARDIVTEEDKPTIEATTQAE